MRYALPIVLTAALSTYCAAGQDDSFTISDQNTSASFDADGQISWTVDGVEQIFDQSFHYRLGGDSFEKRVDGSNLELVGTFLTDTNPFRDQRNDAFGSLYQDGQGLEIETIFTIRGSASGNADLAEQITIRNLSSSTMNITFFQFVDFDLGGDAMDDSGEIINGNTVRQSDDLFSVAETVVTPRPDAFMVGSADQISAMLSDSDIDNLDMSTTFQGNVGWSFQWDITLQAGESFIITKDKSIVPGPGAFALLGLAGTMVAPVRRRRA